jgi:hypothetical protein
MSGYFTSYSLQHGKLKTTLYDNNDDFNFVIVCLFVCFELHEQLFSYLATVTITGDMAANLDLCLAPTAFSS